MSRSTTFRAAISLSSALALVLSACSPKERPKNFAQGDSAEGYYAIAEYKDKEFPLITKSAIGKTDSRDRLTVKVTNFENQRNGKELLPAVKADSTSELVKKILDFEVPLHAKENTKDVYKLKFEFNKDWMDVIKIGAETDFNSQEASVGKKLENGKMAIPYVRMGVSYFYLEPVKNSDNEDTHILRMFPTTDIEKATHFKPNTSTYPEFLDLPSVETVLPRQFFSGEWFYSAILLEAKAGEGVDFLPTGFTLSQAFSIKSVSRIRFDIEQNRLVAKNVNLADGVKKETQQSSIQEDEVLVIPVENVDLTTTNKDPRKQGLSFNYEGENDRYRKPWQEREFLKLDISQVKSTLSKALGTTSSILDVKVTDDYLGFTVEYHTVKSKIRYSLKRAHSPLNGKIAFAEDMDHRFGYFTTDKDAVYNPLEVRSSDFDKYVLINRFFPEQKGPNYKKIVFNFSKTSPKEPAVFRQAAKDAILEWDKAFKKAKLDVELVVDESKDVDLGDIRYNVIDLIDDPMNSGLLGYGPTLADTKSGEIVASSTHIYASNFVNILTENLREYVYLKIGAIKQDQLISVDSFVDRLLEKIDNPINRSELNRVKMNSARAATIPSTQIVAGASPEGVRSTKLSRCSNVSLAMADLEKRLLENCNVKSNEADIVSYIEELKALNKGKSELVTHIPGREAKVLKACALNVAYPMLKHTVLHEIGHNLGLRHNFVASADWRNFADKVDSSNYESVRKQVASSSVMDYLAASAVDMNTPGPYDIAAIRFGYSGEIELADQNGNGSGQFVKINQAANLSSNESINGKKFRNYKFCTDEQIQYDLNEPVLGFEPLCIRHDHGTSALEITKNLLDQFNSSLNLYRYRHDFISSRLKHDEHIAKFFQHVYILPLSKIYVEWRFKLAKVLDNYKQANLMSFTPEQLDEVVKNAAAKMSESERYTFLDYYAAAQLMTDMIIDLASTGPKLCLSENVQGETVAASFTQIAKAATLAGVKVVDCQSEYAQSFIKSKGGVGPITEMGEYYEDVVFNPDRLKERDFHRPDVIGIGALIKDMVSWLDRPLVTKREQFKGYGRQGDAGAFIPSFSEEPLVRTKIIENAYDRALNGLAIERSGQKVYLPIFAESATVAVGLLNPISSRLRGTDQTAEASRITKDLIVTTISRLQDMPLDFQYWAENRSRRTIHYSTKKVDGQISKASLILMKYDLLSVIADMADLRLDEAGLQKLISDSKSKLDQVIAKRSSTDDNLDFDLMMIESFGSDAIGRDIAKILYYQKDLDLVSEVQKFKQNESEFREQLRAIELLIGVNFVK